MSEVFNSTIHRRKYALFAVFVSFLCLRFVGITRYNNDEKLYLFAPDDLCRDYRKKGKGDFLDNSNISTILRTNPRLHFFQGYAKSNSNT